MSDSEPTPFNTIVDYTASGLDVRSTGAYEVIDQIAETKFDIEKKRIKNIFENHTFQVPAYQRLYSWEREQHYEVWEEVQVFVDSHLDPERTTEAADTFFGSMYFAIGDETTEYEIIDGQQRVTTLALLLRAVLEKLREALTGFNDDEAIRRIGRNVSDYIEDLLYVTDSLRGKQSAISLNKHDKEFFDALILDEDAILDYFLSDQWDGVDGRKGVAWRVEDIIDRCRIDSEIVEQRGVSEADLEQFVLFHESNQKLLNGYLFYLDKLEEILDSCSSERERIIILTNLSNYIQNSFFIGRFEISNAGSDFRMQIFEILNDRGIDLTTIDRIRANVVNRFTDENEGDSYITQWEDIVAHFGTSTSQIKDFLAVYLAMKDPDIRSQNEAKNNLLYAFSMRNPPDVEVGAQLGTVQEAEEFINDISEHLNYYDHLRNPDHDHSLYLSESVRKESENILRRLNNLRTSQWLPLMLLTYYYTDNHHGYDEDFYGLLRTVENIVLRRTLAGADPNVIENLFVEACVEFGKYAEEEGVNPYERVANYLIEDLESNTSQMFGRSLVDGVVQYANWSDQLTRQLLWKISSEDFLSVNNVIDRSLDMSDLDLEHILPKQLIGADADETWIRSFFKTDKSETQASRLAHKYANLAEKSENERSNEESEQLEEIENYLLTRFVKDIGNCLLLKDTDNISASNNPLSKKVVAYYNTADFDSIYVNRYFTTENSSFSDGRKERLLTQAETKGYGEIDESVTEYFDELWNYESFAERRTDLLIDLIRSLEFDRSAEEFDLSREYIQSQVDEELDRRLDARAISL